MQNVGFTFFEYQDLIKDVFLLTKLILSIGGATFLSDPAAHGFATIVSYFFKCITKGWPPLHTLHLTFKIHRLSSLPS